MIIKYTIFYVELWRKNIYNLLRCRPTWQPNVVVNTCIYVTYACAYYTLDLKLKDTQACHVHNRIQSYKLKSYI